MKIGIVGCNCRENAIGKSILKNNININVYYIGDHRNIGLDNLGCIYNKINILNSKDVLSWCKKNNIEFVIIGPENPLELGLVDLLEVDGIKCFGPKRDLAQLETNKL